MTGLALIDVIIDSLASQGHRPKKRGNEWYSRCPCHGGNDYDSMSFRESGDGRVLIHCHSKGCGYADILSALYIDTRDTPESYHFSRNRVSARDDKRDEDRKLELVKAWDYKDHDGTIIFQVLKYVDQDGKKSFKQRRPDNNGGHIWNLDGAKKVPYNLPAIAAASTDQKKVVYVVEGEKDADRLIEGGLCATTLPGGAARDNRAISQYTKYFVGVSSIVVIPDNDEPGQKHAEAVRDAFAGTDVNVRIVTLPGLKHKGDVSDWLDDGRTIPELLDEVRRQTNRLTVVDLSAMIHFEFPKRELILDPWIRSQDLSMVHAWRGVGKTHFGIGTAVAVSQGGRFLNWSAPVPRPVLYIDGEMPGDTLKERVLSATILGANGPHIHNNLYFITPDIQNSGSGIRSIATADGQNDVIDSIMSIEGLGLVVLDNLSCLASGVDENDATAWSTVQEFLLRIRRMGIAVLTVHHSGKGGQQRGSSKKEDVLDVVVHLRRPEGYEASDGARFMVEFEKSRGIWGDKVSPFEAHLITDVLHGTQHWSTKSKEECELEQVSSMIRDGMSQSEVARAIGKSKATISRMVKKIGNEGEASNDKG